MTSHLFAAVDLGATSGRVIAGRLADDRFALTDVRRFATPTLTIENHLHWDVTALRDQIAWGVRAAGALDHLAGVGVDTWGVDYGRLNPAGDLLEPPYHYRDHRTNGVPEAFFATWPPDWLYREAGLQTLEFNTVFQYVSAADDPGWADTDRCLLLPDLFTYWLSGAKGAELTIASTTGLLDVSRRQWSASTLTHLRTRYGLDLTPKLPPIVEPGSVVGALDPAILPGQTPVIAVGSHDTASAIASIPATTRRFAYISSGTWSLVGLELDEPILTEESRHADFTNELGIDHTVRYLRNVMGLWVLTESQRQWASQGQEARLTTLLEAAAGVPALTTVINMEDPRLLPPGDMPARLAEMARETGQPVPRTPPEFTRCILDSLALDYRRVIRQAQTLANASVDIVHVVGGGCRNHLLNQLTAEATGLPVVAGPAEGTALGNLLVQARATGALNGDLMDLRRVSRASCDTLRYVPGGLALPESAWRDAESRAHAR